MHGNDGLKHLIFWNGGSNLYSSFQDTHARMNTSMEGATTGCVKQQTCPMPKETYADEDEF
jgi:hypothetical protein